MCSDNFSNYSLKLYPNLEIAKLSTAIRETPHGRTRERLVGHMCKFCEFPSTMQRICHLS